MRVLQKFNKFITDQWVDNNLQKILNKLSNMLKIYFTLLEKPYLIYTMKPKLETLLIMKDLEKLFSKAEEMSILVKLIFNYAFSSVQKVKIPWVLRILRNISNLICLKEGIGKQWQSEHWETGFLNKINPQSLVSKYFWRLQGDTFKKLSL